MPPLVKIARAIAIEKAQEWMFRVSAAGGVSAQVSKTFQNPGAKRGARIDIEVIEGLAFTP